MKNYIIAGILLIFLSGASLFLPSYVMEWQDEQRTEKSQAVEVQEVVLKEQISMTLSEKLKLKEQETVHALELVNGKNYNQDTIYEQAEKEIGILAEQGLLLDFNTTEPLKMVEANVFFYVDMEDSERSIMMWEGVLETLDYQLTFTMDDETGKIVSFSQYYYDRGDVVYDYDGDNMQSTSKAVSKHAWGDLNLGLSTLQEMAEHWGEYLGCEVSESHSAWKEVGFGPDVEEFAVRVETLITKGYTKEEAENKVATEWGLDTNTSCRQLYVTLEDEGGQIGYILWPEKYMFRIDPVLRAI